MKRRPGRPGPLTEQEAFRLPKYPISVVSKLLGVHPQMLRRYEEAGLLEPARQEGKNRLYSDQDISTLEEIASLTDEGVNTTGIRHILRMRQQIQCLQEEIKTIREQQTRTDAKENHQERSDQKQE